MKNKIITFAGLALLLVGVSIWLGRATGIQQAPDEIITTIKGHTIALSYTQGRPVLLTFWATTCESCMEEMPHLITLYNELHGRGLEIIGVAMAYDPPNRVVTVAQQRAVPYPIALDTGGRLARAFGDVALTPTSFLIAPDGRIVRRIVGKLNMAQLRSGILALLEGFPSIPDAAGDDLT